MVNLIYSERKVSKTHWKCKENDIGSVFLRLKMLMIKNLTPN